MKIEFQKKSYTLIIKIQGEIDHHCATELKQKIEKEFQKSDAKILYLILSKSHLWIVLV